MSYQVLSLKWRPQRFEDVLGQEHVVKTLQNAIDKDRVAHAYIFNGPRGVGKTTTARILAKTLNCKNKQGATPCNECSTCLEITKGNNLDVLEIDGASNRGIDEIRELREAVKYPPITGAYRIYIIDEVHMLTTQAFNALLKTLEEPPPHVKFIMATTDPQKVPQTILSRTQRFDFRRVGVQDITGLLERILTTEGIDHTDGALQLLARKADGSIRDGLSLLDQVIAYETENLTEQSVAGVLGLVDDAFFEGLLKAIAAHDLKGVLGKIEEIFERGYDLQEMAQGLSLYFRDALLSLETGDPLATSKGVLVAVPPDLEASDLIAMLQIGLDTESQLRYARQPRVLLEHQWLKMASLDRTASIRELLEKVGSGAPITKAPRPTSRPANPTTEPVAQSDPTTAPEPIQEPVKAPDMTRVSEPTPAASIPTPTVDSKPDPQPRRQFRRQLQGEDAGAEVREVAQFEPVDMGETVANIEAVWTDIMQAIESRSAAVAAILETADIAGMDDGRLAINLRASEAIHLTLVADKKQIIEEIIEEQSGEKVSIMPTIPETAAPTAAKTASDEKSDDAVAQLIDTFEGEDY